MIGSLPNWAGSFSIAIFMLGASAAVLGRWVEEGGPQARHVHRCTLLRWRLSWSPPLGSSMHNLWVVYLGYGVLGGIGLGLGYISPVSTLIKWFPDRPGMATGMAIMGFGGGAFIASPLVGLADAALLDANAYRRGRDVRRDGRRLLLSSCWSARRSSACPRRAGSPQATYAAGASPRSSSPTSNVYVYQALRTPQFWLIWCGALPERHGRHRRARPGLGDEPGDVPRPGHAGRRGRLRRPDEPVQHGRPVLLGVDLRLYRPQEHLLRVLRARHRALCRRAADRPRSAASPCSSLCFRDHHQHVWRRLRHRAGLSARTCSAPAMSAPSTACC